MNTSKMKNNNSFSDASKTNSQVGYNERIPPFKNFSSNHNNNFNNSISTKDTPNEMNSTENIEKIKNANYIPLNSNYGVNKQNKINNFNKNYMNPHQNNNTNMNVVNHASNTIFHQNKNMPMNNITTNYSSISTINPNIQNSENLKSKEINKMNSSNLNDSINTNSTVHANSSVNTNNTAYMNNASYPSTTGNIDNTGNVNISTVNNMSTVNNINNINNMNTTNNINNINNTNNINNLNTTNNINNMNTTNNMNNMNTTNNINNMNYNMNKNYNMQNKMMGNIKHMYNQYPLNMNAPVNIYQNADNMNNPMRMPMYQPQQNMLYNTMNYMNSKAYLKHLKYNKVITADPNIKPNETLYVKNLNDRIKPEELKKNLKDLFKQYGIIKDIIVMKSFWRKGQAWIIYDTIESSTKALNAMQGYFLHGKIMQINYSHNKSDIHSKRDGTFVERSKQPKKPKQIIEREQKQKEIFEKMHKNYLEMQMNNLKMNQNNETEKKNEKIDLTQMDKQTLIAKAQAKAYEEKNKKNEDLSKNNMFSPYYSINTCPPIQNNVIIPYKILFVENVVENVNIQAFNDLFKSFTGFIEARIIPQRNVAFVDFTDEGTATYAMKVLQNYELQGSKLKISYAKR